MRSSAALVGAVAICSVGAIAVLLCVTVPYQEGASTTSKWILALVGVQLVYAVAIASSVGAHGTNFLLRRSALIIVVPTVLVGAFSAIAVGCDQLSGGLSTLVWIVTGVLLTAGVCLGCRYSRKAALRLDEAEYLRLKQKGSTADVVSRSRATRLAVCLPSLFVLPILLFLPESFAVATHIVNRPHEPLGRYVVPVPLHWSVSYYGTSFGSTVISGMIPRGLVRSSVPGVRKYRPPNLLPWAPSLSSWDFESDRTTPRFAEAPFDPLVVEVADTRLTCVEYRPWRPADIEKYHLNEKMIDCYSPTGLAAGFWGEAADVDAFYDVLHKIRLAPDR